jgi:transposase
MGRQLGLRPHAQFEALQAARTRQTTADFKQQYALRAGIEGTISQGVRIGELRRSRYRGQAKTHLQHVLMAVALNLGRLAVWWQEQSGAPLRSIRPPRFATLANSLQLIGAASTA